MPIAGNRKAMTGGNFGSPKIDLGGCVLYAPLWRQDEAGSPFKSSGVYGVTPHTCTVTGAVWGYQGRTFDPATDQISCGTNAVLGFTTALSIFTWYNPTAIGVADSLLTKWDSNIGYMFVILADGSLRLYLHGAVIASVSSDAGLVTTGAFQYIGCTWDVATDSKVRFYKNGSLITTSAAIGAPTVAAVAAIISSVQGGVSRLSGVMGEILAHNRALSAQKIQRNCMATKWRYS